MLENRYLFIDGGHLRKYFADVAATWSGESPDFVVDAIKSTFGAGKCFYYDAVDDQQRGNEDAETFRARLAAEEERYERIQRAYATHVRLGSVTGTQKNRRQKQVDILLAVEMMNHAVRGNMKRAVLLSGDQDFKPLVDSLVEMGLYVDIAGDKSHTSRELINAADAYTPLTLWNYYEWAPGPWKTRYPLPALAGGIIAMPRYKLLRCGQIGDVPVDLSESPGEGFLMYYRHPDQFQYAKGNDAARLELAFTLQYGRILWS